MLHAAPDIDRSARLTESDAAIRLGFRFGNQGTHASRTLMLAELEQLMAATSRQTDAPGYLAAIVDDNVTDKKTVATRRITGQRLRELYALDPATPIFRALRHLWDVDVEGRPLLALLCALARDALLRATASSVLALSAGDELPRQQLAQRVSEVVGNRLNESIADKAARNIASTWTQTGHLEGRVRKMRRRVEATPGSLGLALLFGHWLGLRGNRLFQSFWCTVLDSSFDKLFHVATDAKRLGLIELKRAGETIEIKFGPWTGVK